LIKPLEDNELKFLIRFMNQNPLIDTSEYYFSGGILVKKISNRAFKGAKQEVKVA